MSRHIENLHRIFWSGVKAVQPSAIFSNINYFHKFKTNENREVLKIQEEIIDLTDKKCHIIGFGKAVFGMAVKIDNILEERLLSGVLSISTGSLKSFKDEFKNEIAPSFFDRISIYEGAKDNMPDKNSFKAAQIIVEFAKSMTKNDILFVLISGGGSALLSYPPQEIPFEQKYNLIGKLAHCGATINELNVVRIAMSTVKGGRLACDAKNAHKIVSLIISDIVNDPIDLIASGPTVPSSPKEFTAIQVLKKYNLWNGLSKEIQRSVEKSCQEIIPTLENSSVHLMANNKLATEVCFKEAIDFGYKPFILSTSIEGNVTEITQMYENFLLELKGFINKDIQEDEFIENIPFENFETKKFLSYVQTCKKGQLLCLILAGETTVEVTGTGLGGRNQELALRMSLVFHENPLLKNTLFLSAGTDGIDGPTNAAGAIGCSQIIKNEDNIETFLQNNDSYNFYQKCDNGFYHIITGHTGTNVMDLHLIIIEA